MFHTEGMERIYNAIRMADSQGLIQEGGNQILIDVEGGRIGIRAFVKNAEILSMDAFNFRRNY